MTTSQVAAMIMAITKTHVHAEPGDVLTTLRAEPATEKDISTARLMRHSAECPACGRPTEWSVPGGTLAVWTTIERPDELHEAGASLLMLIAPDGDVIFAGEVQ